MSGINQINFKSSDIVWQKTDIGKAERCIVKNHKPCVIWFTGLNCSGKSTIANALEIRLNKLNYHTYLLDGDNIRHGLNKDLGFSTEDRAENMRRIGEVATLFVDAGIMTLCAFISPFKDDRKAIRSLFEKEEFIEVYVNTPLEVCKQRDVKGHYKKALLGEIKGFTGIDSPYEPPENSEIEIKTAECCIDDAVEKIFAYLKEREVISNCTL
jgi:adenylyl-sulfate kinase